MTADRDPLATGCRWYVWVGQSFAYCDGDGCDKPAWEHDGERVPTRPFGATPDELRPWKPGQAERIRRRWEVPA